MHQRRSFRERVSLKKLPMIVDPPNDKSQNKLKLKPCQNALSIG